MKKSNLKCQLNNLEVDAENSEKENKKYLNNINALEEQNKKYVIENSELKKVNNDLDVQLKRINQINKDNSLLEKYRIKLDEKELELSQASTKTKELEQLILNNKKTNEEYIYQLKNTIISLQDYKDKYEKISEKLKEHQFNTEKLDSLETVYRDYQSLTKKYNALVQENENLNKQKENLDKLLKELEEKLDENNKNLEMLKSKTLESSNYNFNPSSDIVLKYQNQIYESAPNKTINNDDFRNYETTDFKLKSSESQKNSNNFKSLDNTFDKKGSLSVNERKEIKILKEENQFLRKLLEKKEYEINELNSIIKMLEEKQADLTQQSEEQVNEMEILQKTILLKEDTIKELNESINALNEKITLFQNEIFNLNDRINYEHNKKLEEFDILKKENLETKDRYEKEFELIASSIYNLGLNYWSLKLSSSNELNEKPSWLKRERKKYYDGDI
jgi:chromosome segregation ATPase